MKTIRISLTVLGLLAAMSLQASAQGQGRGGFGMMGMMGGGANLLTNKSILKEIKADEKQIEALAASASDLMAKQREAFQGLQDLSPEERREKMTEMGKAMADDLAKALKENLKEEQVKRFHECRLQSMGPRAFMDAEAAKVLAITEEQRGKIQEIMMEQGAQMREIFQSLQDDREAGMKKMAELNKETHAKIVALMSDDQKKSWAKLIGAPFEFVQEMRRPGN
ncbi:MAG: hypothetical protein SFX72_19350 [Isosphaeraceae bacterium]|nr:hypothetical protein [Isosphaeraceae bacterium]